LTSCLGGRLADARPAATYNDSRTLAADTYSIRTQAPPAASLVMPRFEKWLTKIGPDAPVARAARTALTTRLAAVSHNLKRAGKKSDDADDEAEAVHQLRIWTRRATAAIQLFAEILPRRSTRWMKRTLKATRRTAGEVRDFDLLIKRLEKGDLKGCEFIAQDLHKRRKQAEQRLAKSYKKLVGRSKLKRRTDKLLRKVADDKVTMPFGAWCRRALAPLADEFLTTANASLSSDARLHELRIAGKRLRYALELAPAALPTAVHREFYDELSDLQDRLGFVCDQIVALGQLSEWRREARCSSDQTTLRAAREKQARQLAAAKKKFFHWWTSKRRAALATRWRKALHG